MGCKPKEMIMSNEDYEQNNINNGKTIGHHLKRLISIEKNLPTNNLKTTICRFNKKAANFHILHLVTVFIVRQRGRLHYIWVSVGTLVQAVWI